MQTPTQWTAQLRIAWLPVLTFERRRLTLLDWLEEHAEVVGVLDETGRDAGVGVAVGRPEQKLVVQHDGCHVRLEAPHASLDGVMGALNGVYEAMDPVDAHLDYFRTAWSLPLKDEYMPARLAFASRAAGLPASVDFAVSDAAVLADVEMEDRTLQVEYGIVDKNELRDRLVGRATGMMGRNRPMSSGPTVGVPLPDVSLYADVRSFDRRLCPTPDAVRTEFYEMVNHSRRLVASLGGGEDASEQRIEGGKQHGRDD